MAQQESWWLQRNSLQPTGGSLWAAAPPVMGDRHTVDRSVDMAGGRDAAKQEMFNGGRRVRVRSNSQDVAPYGISNAGQPAVPQQQQPGVFPSQQKAPQHGRRSRSHEIPEVTSLQMPANQPHVHNPNGSEWRIGDDQPFRLDGKNLPRQRPVVVPDTNWRSTVDEPVAGYVGTAGGLPPKVTPAASPRGDNGNGSYWRTGDPEPLRLVDNHKTMDVPPVSARERRGSRESLEEFGGRAYRDTRWRKDDGKGEIGQYGVMVHKQPGEGPRPVNASDWRIGDDCPFGFDGRSRPREPLDPRKTARGPRDITNGGDAQPWSLDYRKAAPAPAPASLAHHPPVERLVAAPPLVQGAAGHLHPKPPKESERVRRITREIEEGVEQMANIRPLEEVVGGRDVRRGERRF